MLELDSSTDAKFSRHLIIRRVQGPLVLRLGAQGQMPRLLTPGCRPPATSVGVSAFSHTCRHCPTCQAHSRVASARRPHLLSFLQYRVPGTAFASNAHVGAFVLQLCAQAKERRAQDARCALLVVKKACWEAGRGLSCKRTQTRPAASSSEGYLTICACRGRRRRCLWTPLSTPATVPSASTSHPRPASGYCCCPCCVPGCIAVTVVALLLLLLLLLLREVACWSAMLAPFARAAAAVWPGEQANSGHGLGSQWACALAPHSPALLRACTPPAWLLLSGDTG